MLHCDTDCKDTLPRMLHCDTNHEDILPRLLHCDNYCKDTLPRMLHCDTDCEDILPRMLHCDTNHDDILPRMLHCDINCEDTLPRMPHCDNYCKDTLPRMLHRDTDCEDTLPRMPHCDNYCKDTLPRLLHHDTDCDDTLPKLLHCNIDSEDTLPIMLHCHNYCKDNLPSFLAPPQPYLLQRKQHKFIQPFFISEIPSNILVNHLCTLSSAITSFPLWDDQNCTQYSSCGLTKVLKILYEDSNKTTRKYHQNKSDSIDEVKIYLKTAKHCLVKPKRCRTKLRGLTVSKSEKIKNGSIRIYNILQLKFLLTVMGLFTNPVD
eukprot:g47753.t1